MTSKSADTASVSNDSDSSSSGVAAIANRFNTGAMSSDTDPGLKLSDRVSAMANRFGSTVADNPSGPRFRQSIRYTRPLDMSKYRAVTEPPPSGKDEQTRRSTGSVVNESSKSVNDVAAMFNTSRGFINSDDGKKDGNEDDDEETGFVNAKSLFQQAEMKLKEPEESKVSSFAKKIETDASTSRDIIQVPDDGKLIEKTMQYESKPKNVINNKKNDSPTPTTPTTSSVEDRTRAFVERVKEGQGDDEALSQVESLGNRFANATKLFESGKANSLSSSDDVTITISDDTTTSPKAPKLAQVTSLVSDDSSTTPAATVPQPPPVLETKTSPATPTPDGSPASIESIVAVTESLPASTADGDGLSTPSSRFANAARMFGGM